MWGPPDAETLSRLSQGTKLCAEAMGSSCETLMRLALVSERARAAGIGEDGRVLTQQQAEAMLGLLRDWYRQSDRRRREKGR